jgi:5'-3' exonuclease
MPTIAAIDGDILCYECGFASDAAAKATGMTREPLGFCLNGVNKKIDSILKNTEADDYIVFLTGSPVMGLPKREELFSDYKKNRDSSHKPIWYKEIKEHLLKKHPNVLVIDGLEADDYLGMFGYEDNVAPDSTVVIASKDKDLDMIPGYHYNWSKTKVDKGVYYVDPLQGMRWFCEQMLVGDSTDNIPGLFKLFGKKATAALKKPLEELDNYKDLLQYVLDQYEGDEALFLRNGELLWIRRQARETFTDFYKRR